MSIWAESVIDESEIEKFAGGGDFINDEEIETLLAESRKPEKRKIRRCQ